MSDFVAFCKPISKHIKRMVALVALMLVLTSVNTDAQCIRYPAYWSYTLYQPGAGVSRIQGQSLVIEWGFGYNPWNLGIYVKLEWSTNNGSTWTLIAEDIAGNYNATNTYTWNIPMSQPPSTNYKVRISEDVSNGCWNGSYYMNEPAVSPAFTILSACAAPIITTQPATSSVCVGTSKTFTVVSDMTNGTYQWKKEGNTIATTTVPSYTINNVTTADAGVYSVLLTQNCNTSFTKLSSNATLTVNLPPAITKQPPATLAICQSGRDTIKAGASGIGKTFQWYKNGVAIALATDSNLVLDNAQLATEGSYHVVASGTCAPPAVSNATVVTVVLRPSITTEPQSLALCPGSNGQLSVVAQGSSLSYQWFRNNQPVAGSGATMPFTGYSIAQDGQYFVEVTSNVPNPNNCQVKVRSAIVTVTGYRPPTIVSQPVAVEGCVGKSVTLTSEFEGFGLTYSWTRNGVAIPNSASNSLLLSNLTTAMAGDYRVTATGTCGLTASSNAVRVNVVKTPTFSAQPMGQDLTAGEPLNLSLAASDASSIQWFKDGVALAGQTGTTLNIPNVTLADAGFYHATVKNSCSGIVSATARVTVIDPTSLQPRLTLTQPSGNLGEIPLGYSVTTEFGGLISNTGTADMEVQSVETSDIGFAVTSGNNTPFTLAPGASSNVTIRANAENLTAMAGTLTVTTNAPIPTGTFAMMATPVLRYDSPTSLNFGEVFDTESKDTCVQIVNNSTTDISIEQGTISGPDGNLFTLTSAMPLNIAAGATADLCVAFAPTTPGTNFTAQMNLVSSTGGNTTLAMNGAGLITVGVNDLEGNAGLAVYPNPASDEVSIRTVYPSTITIVNSRGVKVASLSTTADKLVATWNTKNTNGAAVAAGTYTVSISGQQGTVTMPLVVVR